MNSGTFLKVFFLCNAIALCQIGYGQFGDIRQAELDMRPVSDCDRLKTLSSEDKMQAEIEREYRLLLGILSDLAIYREKFLRTGDLIEIFPSSYYHTTKTEMTLILQGQYKYPIEKMRQMVAFYDAYKANRLAWDQKKYDLVEPHWKKQFDYAATANQTQNFLCADIGEVLALAIKAHVENDLPRAIRFAFVHRFDPQATEPLLKADFDKTDAIFGATVAKTTDDISSARKVCGAMSEYILNFPEGKFAIKVTNALHLTHTLTDESVISIRHDAWALAFSNQGILDESGNSLWRQPQIPHDALVTAGNKLCRGSDAGANDAVVYNEPSDLFTVRQFKVPAVLSEPFDTRVDVNEDDYVYIQASGKVTIGLFAGSVTAEGTSNPFLKSYNKYPFNHACLVYKLGDSIGGFKKLFQMEHFDTRSFVYYYLSTYLDQMFPGGESPVGIYFLAAQGGRLLLDLNDNKISDNSGTFTVTVMTMKRSAHLRRNLFNTCPQEESSVATESWTKEPEEFSSFYHGENNRSYRGASITNKGCQCVYDRGTRRLVGDKFQGSFDIGNWLSGRPGFQEEKEPFLHLIFDVLPHDLYEKKFGEVRYINR